MADQWLSFPEFERGSWSQFPDCLKIKYPELTSEEQETMGQLYKLYRKNLEISMLDKEKLIEFKCKFMYIVQKCLRPLAITGNCELVELFVQYLDITFQNVLNSRLNIQGMLKVNTQRRSCMKNFYDLEHVVQKAIDLVSGKTIVKALKHMLVIMSRNSKVNPESREQISFSKIEPVRKVEMSTKVETIARTQYIEDNI